MSAPKSRKGQTPEGVNASAAHPVPAPDAPFDPGTFLAKVGEGRSTMDYRKNRIVFAQGDKADAVFFLRKGKVKLTVVSNQGKEAVVAILDEGAFFGEGCLVAQPLRMATAATLTPCAILRLEKSAMIRLLHTEPAFGERFIAHLLARNIRIEEDLVDQLFNSAEKRLARLLLLLANFGKEGKPEAVIPKISQETLAEMIGTTRSRVNFFMNKFRKLGFLDYNDGLEVNSSLLNVILHD
ncbi:MAG TPA: Crp/Fnr family transcriptional regulator [Candidatus Methylomirabilis sp.]|nr:Crp/Fnr family transcriptional regulator [Candidatus Methylomirabilis sp.]HSB82062.1 Crp/Fnr family transcriptional regulator [Candidatus Methylomirabilis sp.]